MELTVPNLPALTLPDADHPAPPRIVGVLNVTPDSFSDGGRYLDPARAVAHALTMAGQGADVIDVGGESTRPGARRTGAAEQKTRVIDVIQRLRAALDENFPQVLVSIDTTLAPVAEAALEAGASIINDISAGRDDPAMLPLAAARRVPIVLMHMQGQPGDMQDAPHYDDVAGEVKRFLLGRAAAAQHAGVERTRIVIDPGIGFGKTAAHNLTLIAELRRLVDTGYPVLVGASRKRFIAHVSGGDPQADDTAPEDRLPGTCAVTALATAAGAQLLRVHDVAANRQAARVAFAVARSRAGAIKN